MDCVKRTLSKERLKGSSQLIIFVLSVCAAGYLGCATGYLGSPSPSIEDPCLEGIFSDGYVLLQVVEHQGMVTAAGSRAPTAGTPWDLLFFSGTLRSEGTARGRVTLYFPSGSGSLSTTHIVNVVISLPSSGGSCGTTLSFALTYDWEGSHHDETYSLVRQP